ncbi:hypothetical protein [uncultured Algimonas sp.]|uniref:hypothetical protein n=1 Tax=uncultured Algimonas sp. TaxID=1547920 RepID=UPI00263346F2|nr:hypothetical protein [uncultured Algimonas sp.]
MKRLVPFRDDVPDAKGGGLILIAFFVILGLVVRLDLVKSAWLDMLLGGLIGAAAMLLVLWLVKRLGWTRPRRDGEWL